MRLVRRADIEGRPWKNGGGTTWELASEPLGASFDTFLWRLSIAEVAQPGAFSSFPGIDCTLTLLDGAELLLEFSGGSTVRLTPGDAPLAFPGEAGVTARIPGGTVLDFNVMSRRGRVAHHVLPTDASFPHLLNCAALLCRAGHTTYMGFPLAPGDLLLLEAAERLAPLALRR